MLEASVSLISDDHQDGITKRSGNTINIRMVGATKEHGKNPMPVVKGDHGRRSPLCRKVIDHDDDKVDDAFNDIKEKLWPRF